MSNGGQPLGQCSNPACIAHAMRVPLYGKARLCRDCDNAAKKTDYLYRRALDTFGADAQINMAIEEGAELTVALQHYKRGRGSNVVTEIADVLIMAGQMRLLFGSDRVDAEIEEKLERLRYRLERLDGAKG